MLSSSPRNPLGKISKLLRIRVVDLANAMPDASLLKRAPLRRTGTPKA